MMLNGNVTASAIETYRLGFASGIARRIAAGTAMYEALAASVMKRIASPSPSPIRVRQPESKRRVDERSHNREQRQEHSGRGEIPCPPRGDNAHVQQEERQHAQEDAVGERRELAPAGVAGDKPDQQAPDDQDDRAADGSLARHQPETGAASATARL